MPSIKIWNSIGKTVHRNGILTEPHFHANRLHFHMAFLHAKRVYHHFRCHALMLLLLLLLLENREARHRRKLKLC